MLIEMSKWEPKLLFGIYVHDTNQFQKPFDTYTHWCCFIVDEGKFNYQMDDIKDVALKNDLIICPPGTTFYRKTEGLSFHYIGFEWNIPVIPQQIAPNGKIQLMNTKRVDSTLALLRDVNASEHDITLNYKNHLFSDLWKLYIMESTNQILRALMTEDPLLQQVIFMIDQGEHDKISLKSIAEKLNINQSHLTRIFKREFGITPNAYVQKVKMARVKYMLVHTTLTLAEIAELCGFTDEHHLSKNFKKNFNINPSVYRRNIREL